MKEAIKSNDIEKRRENYIERFCRDLMNALFFPKSSQEVVAGIDIVFTKLKRLIKKHSREDNNKEFQRKIFTDICRFLNELNDNFKVKKFHNAISKTSIEEYKNMTLGEQFYNNAYEDYWEFDYDCKGGSCTYRTLTLYKFFDTLRESGLDIKLSIYRFKNTDDDFIIYKLKNTNDNIAVMTSMRHSGLVINFQGHDYMVDYEGINDVFSGCLIQDLDSLKEDIKNLRINEADHLDVFNIEYLGALKIENREKNTSREGSDNILIHFKNIEDFLVDVKEHPDLKKVSFIDKELKDGEPTRLAYEFASGGVSVMIDEYQRIFILKKNAKLKKNKTQFLKSLINNTEFVQDEYGLKKITQADKEELCLLLGKIEKDINLDSVICEYQ